MTEYSLTGVLPIAVEMASVSKVSDPAERRHDRDCTVQMTFMDSHVSSVSKNEAFVPEDQLNDVPRGLLYHL